MSDLTEKALEACLADLYKLNGKEPINIRPTKLIMVPYPGETVEAFNRRVVEARRLVARMGKEK